MMLSHTTFHNILAFFLLLATAKGSPALPSPPTAPSLRGTERSLNENQYMATFFKEVDVINADIKAVLQASNDIRILNEKWMRVGTTAEEKSLSKEVGLLISQTNKRAKQTKTLLALLKEETEKLKEEGKLNASNVRVRENMTTGLTNKFIDEMKTYQEALQKFKTDFINKNKANQWHG